MINTLIQGVLLGGYYALIAAGLSFMFSVMRIINLAHGSLAVLAAYALFVLAKNFGISPFLGLLIVLPADGGARLCCCSASCSTARCAPGRWCRSSRPSGSPSSSTTCCSSMFGANTRSLAPYHRLAELRLRSQLPGQHLCRRARGLHLRRSRCVVLGGLQLFLSFTPLGRAIRATSEDPDTAGLVGINARRVNAVAAAIALVTVGLAGAALGMRGTFDAYAGGAQLLFAFEAAVIGGAGSVWGTLIGGIVLALAQSLGATISPLGFLIAGHARVPRRAVRPHLARGRRRAACSRRRA